MLNFLDRLNVTLEEYVNLVHEHDRPEKEKFTMELFRSSKGDRATQIRFMNDCWKQYDITNDFFYLSNWLTLALNSSHTNGVFEQNTFSCAVKEMKNHLNRVESWGIIEMVTFINCASVFSTEFLIGTMNEHEWAIKRLGKSFQGRKLQTNLYLNTIQIMIDRYEYTIAQQLVLRARTLEMNVDMFFEKILLVFFEELLFSFQGANTENCSQIVQFLKMMGEKEKSDQLQEMIGHHCSEVFLNPIPHLLKKDSQNT